MEKKFIAATGNAHKLVELRRILEPMGFEVIPADKSALEGIVENGKSFRENSLIKARHIFERTGLPTIADDSGISIDALRGLPGIYSARFLGDTPYEITNQVIIDALEGLKGEERSARFICCICVVTKCGEYTFEGVLEGRIANEIKGSNGFGYDPIFSVGEKTTAELSDEEKDEISHRGRALKKLQQSFSSIKF